jgi:DNA-binding MarR family transcriptional regulator
MSFDPLVANAGRLRILTELAVEERQEFVNLRRRTQLTDGNLAAHARRLKSAGLIEIDKQFRAGKPVTSYLLTADGRRALESHARRLIAAISQRRRANTSEAPSIAHPEPTPSPARPPSRPARINPEIQAAPDIDDWVD